MTQQGRSEGGGSRTRRCRCGCCCYRPPGVAAGGNRWVCGERERDGRRTGHVNIVVWSGFPVSRVEWTFCWLSQQVALLPGRNETIGRQNGVTLRKLLSQGMPSRFLARWQQQRLSSTGREKVPSGKLSQKPKETKTVLLVEHNKTDRSTALGTTTDGATP